MKLASTGSLPVGTASRPLLSESLSSRVPSLHSSCCADQGRFTKRLAPFPPLRHGHAITIDMSYTIIMSHSRGLLTDHERDEWFDLAQNVGLTVDHTDLDEGLLFRSIEAITKTRDGKQRFVLAGPYGKCMFANDISDIEFRDILAKHKGYVQSRYPETKGAGQDAYADAGDLGADPEALKREKEAAATANSNGSSSSKLTPAPKEIWTPGSAPAAKAVAA